MRSFIHIKKEKIKINKLLIEKYKDMLTNPDFEKEYNSRTATGINKVGQGSIR